MTGEEMLDAVAAGLQVQGLSEVELFLKRGRSRRFEIGAAGRRGVSTVERGWAVRAGGPRSSLFVSGTGPPGRIDGWPEPDGQPLRLPDALSVPRWRPPEDLDHALVAESEAVALLESITGALESEIPGCRLLCGRLEEGTSETSILNTRGVRAEFKSRAASLYVEVVGPWSAAPPAALTLAAREHRAFHPPAIARRLANRLLLSHRGETLTRDRGEVLVGAAVAGRLLAGLLPLFLGGQADEHARRLADRRGRVGSEHLTVVDNGRLPGGVLESPVDGEGVPTGSRVLVENGRYRGSLRDWREMGDGGGAVVGCCRRDGWRDLPAPAPSHLFLAPDPAVSVGDLLGSIARGHYLLEPLGPARFDFSADRFRIPVCGFVLRQGSATSPLSRTWLEGGITTLLRNLRGTARDLSFEPLPAMIGAPTLLVGGLGLRGME